MYFNCLVVTNQSYCALHVLHKYGIYTSLLYLSSCNWSDSIYCTPAEGHYFNYHKTIYLYLHATAQLQ